MKGHVMYDLHFFAYQMVEYPVVDMPVFNKMVEKYLTVVNYPYVGFGSTVMVIQSI